MILNGMSGARRLAEALTEDERLWLYHAVYRVMRERGEIPLPCPREGNAQDSALTEGEKVKRRLLSEARLKRVHDFFQVDCFPNVPQWDDVMPGDADGDALCAGFSHELRNCADIVRVQFPAGLPAPDAVRMLRKILTRCEADYDGMAESVARPTAGEEASNG